MGGPWNVGETYGPVSGKVLHGIGRGVQSFEVWGLDLIARLHPLAKLPLSEVSKLSLAEAGLSTVQAGHVVGQ